MNIVNLVNFIRADDYRFDNEALKDTTRKEMELAKKYKMPITFLFTHAALMKPDFVELVEKESYVETGLWMELDRDLVEKAGCVWKGQPDRKWEYFSHIVYLAGYTQPERVRIIDIVFSEYKNVFGEYPKTVGSWTIDAFSLNYMQEKYGITASLNCKDQWFTDGYSLWGGYYNGGFYPSKNNALAPAQTKEEQINVPVFRMLGSDPIKQYSAINGGFNGQSVISLEPVYPWAGGSREWVEWFFEQMMKYDTFSLGYAQAGQENSFSWDLVEKGYKLQLEILDRLYKDGKINMMSVADTGKWFKENYDQTPVLVMEADCENEHVVWYNSRYYRAYLYTDGNDVYIKDINIFDEKYPERYLEDTCKIKDIFYDNLPLVDQYRWSEKGKNSGLFFAEKGEILAGGGKFTTEKEDEKTLRAEVAVGGRKIIITFREKEISFKNCDLKWLMGDNELSQIKFGENISLIYNGFERNVDVSGKVIKEGIVKNDDGEIIIRFAEK